jgi:hypothetical protein
MIYLMCLSESVSADYCRLNAKDVTMLTTFQPLPTLCEGEDWQRMKAYRQASSPQVRATRLHPPSLRSAESTKAAASVSLEQPVVSSSSLRHASEKPQPPRARQSKIRKPSADVKEVADTDVQSSKPIAKRAKKQPVRPRHAPPRAAPTESSIIASTVASKELQAIQNEVSSLASLVRGLLHEHHQTPHPAGALTSQFTVPSAGQLVDSHMPTQFTFVFNTGH